MSDQEPTTINGPDVGSLCMKLKGSATHADGDERAGLLRRFFAGEDVWPWIPTWVDPTNGNRVVRPNECPKARATFDYCEQLLGRSA